MFYLILNYSVRSNLLILVKKPDISFLWTKSDNYVGKIKKHLITYTHDITTNKVFSVDLELLASDMYN